MLEVLVAMALVAMVSSVLVLPVYKMFVEPKRPPHSDLLFYEALKEVMAMDIVEKRQLLAEGGERYYEGAIARYTVSGYSPLKKRKYYLVEVEFSYNNENLGSYNFIIKDET